MPADRGERLDLYLVRTGHAASRRDARAMIERGAVMVKGRRAKKGDLLMPGDQVEVEAPPSAEPIEPQPEIALEVLFEDPSMIVVNKPGAIPCHPLRAGERGTVMNAAVARYPETASAGDKRLEGGLIHRLDNGTSGALLIARSNEAFAQLRSAIRSGAVRRRYLALVAGHLPKPISIATPVAHHPKNPRRMVTVEDEAEARRIAARPAFSAVEPIRRVGQFTLVAVTPATGMRHQIRVHLASIGNPIVGDTLYGGPASDKLAPGRFWLHLEEIAFESPASGTITVKAPLPPDLQSLLR